MNAAGPPSAAQPFPESGGRGIAKTENSWRPPRREGSAAALEEEDEEEDVVVDVEEDDDADEAEELPGSVKGHAAARVSLKVRRRREESVPAVRGSAWLDWWEGGRWVGQCGRLWGG